MILVRHGQSEFNVHFGATRQDPGIRDAPLTDLGWAQARLAGQRMQDLGLTRLVISPYTRTLQTAAGILETLDVPVTIDHRIGERAWFTCDIGTPTSQLKASWPHIVFDHLDEEWWPTDEDDASLQHRTQAFRSDHAGHDDWESTGCVTHWGVIRALTGIEVGNTAIVRFNPTASTGETLHHSPENADLGLPAL